MIDDVSACSRSDSLDPGSRSGTVRLAQVGGGDQKLDAVDDVVSFRPSCGVGASEDVFFRVTHLNPSMQKHLHGHRVAKLDSLQVAVFRHSVTTSDDAGVFVDATSSHQQRFAVDPPVREL